jgi:hypothetical protein
VDVSVAMQSSSSGRSELAADLVTVLIVAHVAVPF